MVLTHFFHFSFWFSFYSRFWWLLNYYLNIFCLLKITSSMSPSTLLLLLSYGKLLFSVLLCCSYCSYFCTLLFTCCCTEYKHFAFAFISQSIFIVGWIVVHATKVFDSIWQTHSSGTHRLININYKKVFVIVSYFLMIYRKISAVPPWVLRAIVKILLSDRLWRTEL